MKQSAGLFFSMLAGGARCITRCVVGTALFASISPSAEASNLVFQGQNAGLFSTANPAGTAVLMNSVAKPVATSAASSITPATQIQQSIVSQISSRIYNEIFKGSGVSGYYDLGGGNSISYLREGGYITVTINSTKNGTTTLTVLDQ
jgi:hypothetical protein